MSSEAFQQPPYDRALELLRSAGLSLPDVEPGEASWLHGVVEGLLELATRDVLTGLVNRRVFEGALAREAGRVVRGAEPALLLLLDIDHFKRINDTHGHAAGDAVLRVVARAIADQVRPMDLVARIGGEEFGVILPGCGVPFAQSAAERIRDAVAQAQTLTPEGLRLSATVSIGGAFAGDALKADPVQWCARADHQLYQAKSEGRDRTCIEQPFLSDVSADERAMLFAWALDEQQQGEAL
jgi:diguanylate cyclase (GGDEF)-like protein